MTKLLDKIRNIKQAKYKLPGLTESIFNKSIFKHTPTDSIAGKNESIESTYNEVPFENTLKFSQGTMAGSPSKATVKKYPVYNRTFSTSNNVNTPPSDFPSLQGMPVPNPSNYTIISTGNGKGSEIISRPQVKYSSIFGSESNITGRDRNEDETIPPFYDAYREDRDSRLRIIDNVSKYLPFYYMGKASKDPVSGAVAGGITGIGTGALGGLLYNLLQKNPGSYLTSALAGAGILGLGGAITGSTLGWQNRNINRMKEALNKYGAEKKTAGFMPPFGMASDADIKQALIAKLMSDMSLNYSQKNALQSYIQNLDSRATQSLKPLMSGVIGSGIGAAIANKLLGMGYTGTILFSIIGGIMGYGLNSSQPSISQNFVANRGFHDINGNLI